MRTTSTHAVEPTTCLHAIKCCTQALTALVLADNDLGYLDLHMWDPKAAGIGKQACLIPPTLASLDVHGNARMSLVLPPSFAPFSDLRLLDVSGCAMRGSLPQLVEYTGHSAKVVRAQRHSPPLPPTAAANNNNNNVNNNNRHSTAPLPPPTYATTCHSRHSQGWTSPTTSWWARCRPGSAACLR